MDTGEEVSVPVSKEVKQGFGQLKQSRSTIVFIVILLLLGDIIFLILGNFIKYYPIFSTSFPSFNPTAYWVSLFIDIFLGFFLILGKEWARKLTVNRLILGIIGFSIYYIITGDYPFLIAIVGSNAAFILKLTKSPGTWMNRHAYDLFIVSNIAAIVVGIIYVNTPHSIKDYTTIQVGALSSAVPTEWVNNPMNAISDIFPSPYEGEEGITNESFGDESGSARIEFTVIDWAKYLEDDYTWDNWNQYLLDTNKTRIGFSNQFIESIMDAYNDVVKIDSQTVKIDFKDSYEYAYSGNQWIFPGEQRLNFLTAFGEDTFAIVGLTCDLNDWNRVEDIWLRIRNSIEID